MNIKSKKELLKLINHILNTPDHMLTMADMGYKAALRDILTLSDDDEEQDHEC